MTTDQQLTATINTARSATHGDDTVATMEALRLARRAAPDAVRLLHNLIRDDAVAITQRTRASVALLEVGGFLGGAAAAEIRSSAALREPAEGNGASRDAA